MRTNDPATVQMLAYGQLITKEAQQHQGNGWLEYDGATIDLSRAWNILLHSHLPFWEGLVHWELEYIVQGVLIQTIGQTNLPTIFRLEGIPPSAPRNTSSVSSNIGRCVFQENCTFQHICAVCYQLVIA